MQSIKLPPTTESARLLSASQRTYVRLKRVFDVLCAFFGFLISLPVLAVACLAIMRETPGSPIFTQLRTGANGKPFKLYKLRTMYANTEHLSCITKAGDPRVTRVGRWLRDTKIDELPQLLNIIRGDMSIIGPRPLSTVECDVLRAQGFDDAEPGFIPQLQPGLVGLEQLSRERNLDYAGRFALNAMYERNAGWYLDSQVLFHSIIQCRVVVYLVTLACIGEILLLLACAKGTISPPNFRSLNLICDLFMLGR